MNDKYKEEIEINTKSLRNPNVQKQFKDYLQFTLNHAN